METITTNLIKWYEKEKRTLPWRETSNPYYIWVSEIMLQQTKVEVVKTYYEQFITTLPTIKDLAEIDEDKLLKLWEGLGYYSRVRNMQKAAKILINKGYDNLPNNKEELLALPGIGNYTAGAILSIAFHMPSVAIDGNVYRVLGRYYTIEESISKSSTYSIYAKKMEKILPTAKASEFTQSFMDLGSFICTPKKPKCHLCPLQKNCKANKKHITESYPVKMKKKAQKIEERSIYIYMYKDKIAIQKRKNKGLLASMYEFPNDTNLTSTTDIENKLLKKNINYQFVQEIGESKHVFSHIIWYMKGYLIVLKEPLNQYLWVTKKDLKEKYSLPSAFTYYYQLIMQQD